MLQVKTLIKKTFDHPKRLHERVKIWGIGTYNGHPVTFWGVGKAGNNMISNIKAFDGTPEHYEKYMRRKLTKGYQEVDEPLDLSEIQAIRVPETNS